MIRPEDIEHAARLARLRLTGDERTRIERDLRQVVAHVDELFAADVDEAAPLERGPLVEPKVRADEDKPVLGRAALEGGAGFDGALVRVPKVVE